MFYFFPLYWSIPTVGKGTTYIHEHLSEFCIFSGLLSPSSMPIYLEVPSDEMVNDSSKK